MRCPNCGAELPAHGDFCMSCGQRVDRAPLAEPQEEGDETVLMDMPDDEPTMAGAADATVSADASSRDETVLMDQGKTRLLDDAETRVSPRVGPIPITTLPDDTMAAPAPVGDGLDALDDPYAPIVTGSELTNIAPVVKGMPAQSEDGGARHARRWPIVLGIIAVLALAAFGAYYTWERELWGGRTVPDVVGQTQDAATRALEAEGFTVNVSEKAEDEGVGNVLYSDPVAGKRIDPADGVTITVAVSRTIPSVLGMTVNDAEKALYDVGATNLTVQYQASTEAEGTVIAVSPDVGSAFVSTDAIALTVAQAYTVPNVVGASLSDAQAAIEAAGYASVVSYVDSDAKDDVVISTDPTAGTRLDPGSTVTLTVPNPFPSDYRHLLEFFGCTPVQDATYLAQQQFTEITARKLSSGNAFGVYQKGNDVLYVTDAPETGTYDIMSSTYDALANGCAVGGLRLRLDMASLSAAQTEVSTNGVQAVLTLCGLTGMSTSCTEADFSGTEGITISDVHFICAYGEQDGYAWTVLIGGYTGNPKVVVTAAPKSHYSSMDLSGYGNSICKYVAYTDLFAR